MKLVVEVPDHQILPAGYGVAWIKYESRKSVCMPIPLNIVAAVIRGAYLWARYGYRAVPISPRDAYHQGLQDAHKEQAK